jgi:uncharacterized NAD(P)/FAD-binding protein YdhS
MFLRYEWVLYRTTVIKWIQNRGISAAEWDFLPRYLYREYILELTHSSVSENRDFTQFEYIRGEVLDIEIINGRARIHLGQNDDVFADTVVLALGNFPPRDPPIQNLNALKSRRYVRNPWPSNAITSLSPHGTVVFIGTGQTMIDLAISLHMCNHNGEIIGRDGGRSKVLYTLGSTMRGVLWEVLAVPEIRVQAEQLARLILFESQK